MGTARPHIPAEVRRELRREVGFACAIPGCGIPYLSWHHFDPPFREEVHNRPEGMIALCPTHAAHADGGAYTVEYLRKLKEKGELENETVTGQLQWMRRDLLAVIGGSFFYEQLNIFTIDDEPSIWFTRDEDGYLLLNLRMPTFSGQRRVRIEENYFTAGVGEVADIECATRGRKMVITYPNGDKFWLKFRDLESPEAAAERYPAFNADFWCANCTFPLTVLLISEKVADSPIEFGPRKITFGGDSMQHAFMARNDGWALGITARDANGTVIPARMLFPD